ncbi:MAG: RHS repeat-associated core domain-containing protein [Chloroflexi bacterium]|nr:RHS repeat-associated core domain-containing protein [Chloroflexota bacterium]
MGGKTNYYFNQFDEQIDGTIYHWLWLGNRRVAHGSLHSGVNYLYADQLGSTVTSHWTMTDTQKYEAYGATRGTGTVATAYQYTGQRNEAALGIYYGARWYDPALGRFIQADSIVPEPGNPQSLNRYSYVLNNPMRYTDPSGMFTEDELINFGISSDEIKRWKEYDLAWWQLLCDAQLGNYVQLAKNSPFGLYWQFSTLDFKLDRTPAQLMLFAVGGSQAKSLTDFQSTSAAPGVHYDLLSSLSESISDGSYSVRRSYYGTAIGPRAKTPHLIYDFDALGQNLLDVVGIMSAGASQYANSDSVTRAANIVNAAASGLQLGVSIATLIKGGDAYEVATIALTVASTARPEYAIALGTIGLAIGVIDAFRIEYR